MEKEQKLIIGLVGQISSGKGTVAKYLEDKYKAKTHRFSTMLRDVLNRMYCEITRDNMQSLSTYVRKQHGEDILAKVMAKDVQNDNAEFVVVDGVRRMADIKYLKEIPGFKLISIEADPKIRYNRIVGRGENEDDAKKTYEQFLEDQKQEADAEIPLVMKKADYTLNNNSDFENLYSNIDKLINNLK